MRKPDQNGRSFESARPFAIAAEANSRIPKWKLRPDRSPGEKSPAPSKASRVVVDGRDLRVPAVGERTALHALDLVRESGKRGPVLREECLPRLTRLPTT